MRTKTMNIYDYDDMIELDKIIYDYDDMIALEKMSPKEALDIIGSAWGYIDKYISLKEGKEYSEDDYYNYKIRCAFKVAFGVLEGEQNEQTRHIEGCTNNRYKSITNNLKIG